MKPTKLLFLLLALLTALRLWACQHFQVQPNEAYWYLCSTHPALAYYDAPGGLPLLVWLSTKCFGISAIGLRLFMPLFALMASGILFLISRKHLKGWLAIFPVVAVNCLPVFNQTATRLGWEMPAFAFGLLAFASGWHALEKENTSRGWWMLSGIAAGCAFFTHVSMVFISISMIAALLSVRKFRARIWSPVFIAFLTPTIIVLGILIRWNQQHDWIWLATGTLQSAMDFSIPALLSAVQNAAGELTPLFYLLAAYVFFNLFHRARLHIRARVLLAFCLPAGCIWLYLCLLGFSHAILLLIPLCLLLITFAESMESEAAAWQVFIAKAALPLAAIATVWNLSPTTTPWPDIAAAVQHEKTEAPTPLFLIAQDADIASILSYQLNRAEGVTLNFPPVFVKESQAMQSQFALWPRYEQFYETGKAPDDFFTELKATNPYVDKSALFVCEEPELPQTIQGAFQHVTLIETISFPEKSGGVRRIRIYLCENYQTMPL
ncbi:MAG: glycosyltransferase family 39 protein [Chthoniobacterales bacterium]